MTAVETVNLEREIINYVISIGGNEVDVEQIFDEVVVNGYTTMEQVKEHIDNYY